VSGRKHCLPGIGFVKNRKMTSERSWTVKKQLKKSKTNEAGPEKTIKKSKMNRS
jgi:hypothetical protein